MRTCVFTKKIHRNYIESKHLTTYAELALKVFYSTFLCVCVCERNIETQTPGVHAHTFTFITACMHGKRGKRSQHTSYPQSIEYAHTELTDSRHCDDGVCAACIHNFRMRERVRAHMCTIYTCITQPFMENRRTKPLYMKYCVYTDQIVAHW